MLRSLRNLSLHVRDGEIPRTPRGTGLHLPVPQPVLLFGKPPHSVPTG